MLSKNLKELRKRRGMTQSELAQALNVSVSTVGNWEIGSRNPDLEMLKSIANLFGVTTDRLLGAERGSLISADNLMPIAIKKVPLLGDIACGEPIFADEQYGEFMAVSGDIDCDFCLRAKGDSMIRARIMDGDIVFIRSQSIVDNGEIAAVVIDNEATLKRVYYYPAKNKLVLNPENPAYEPLVYVGEECDQIRILGKAVAFQSLVR